MTILRAALDEALQFHQAGNLEKAEFLYQQVLRQWPGQPDALNLLGVMANQVGQPEVGIDLIGQAIAKLPNEPDFHGNLAAAYQAVGRVADAVRHFREAIRLKPGAVNYRVFLSEGLQQQVLLDEALAHAVARAAGSIPTSALAYCMPGRAGRPRLLYALTAADIQHMQDLLDAGGQSAPGCQSAQFHPGGSLGTPWRL